MTEEEVATVFSALEQKRREWEGLLPAPGSHFRTTVSGGKSTFQRLDVEYDCAMATYRTQETEDFCLRYRTGRQKSYVFA
eukprot:7886142-Lingulodinium_polyedra.AAC.1